MLELKNICKKFRDFSLDDISFTAEKHDYFILLGESGAGKSMILETIAGLIQPDKGKILLNNKNIIFEKIQKRNIGLVFQDHAIFPHMNVESNIEYSLHNSGKSSSEKKNLVRKMAEELEIENILHRRPVTLSGGELQRVGLARTLIQKPEVLLLDEPLAAIDIRLKTEIRELLHRIHKSGQTIIHVTHDYEEALALGKKIAVLNDGKIIQQGEPEEVFSKPASEFVAHFTGARNFFKATADSGPDGNMAVINNKLLLRISESHHGSGYVMIREEDIFLSEDKIISSATNNFEGRILRITPTSRGIDVTIEAGVIFHSLITKESLYTLGLQEGKTVWIHFKATSVRYISS